MSQLLDPILKPSTVAVIGASRTPFSIGHQVVANLVDYGFTGAVYPVNPKARAINAIRAYPTVGEVPDQIDMAVIMVPKEHVLPVVQDCADHGVKGVVVISAGFKEIGGAGVAREAELLEVVRRSGMRMVGPNCMGVLNADPAFSMNATFAPTMPPFGRVGFVSQSGAMGLSVLDYAREYGIGISQFVSMGNKPDVSGNDVLLQWENDPTVDVILMYVESFGNPMRFRDIAQRITKRKPIIVVKAGRSEVGARAASSHTGALAEGDAAVGALMDQVGVIRAQSVEELFDLAMGFEGGKMPRGDRVAILTNSGGPGILTADALAERGLTVPELSDATVEKLQPLFPPEASVRNPLDMIASATPEGYHTALGALLADDGIDAAVVIFVPPLGVRQKDVAQAIAEVGTKSEGKPVLTVLMGRKGLPQGKAELHDAGIPAFIFPESAVRAIAAMHDYQTWRERPEEPAPELAVDRDRAAEILGKAGLATKLSENDALDLLAAYGIPTAQARLATSEGEAAEMAQAIGGQVAMKIVSPQIVHKTDVGGVVIGVEGADEARLTYRGIVSRAVEAVPEADVTGVLVQEMVIEGREAIVGMSRDRIGPLLMFGLGGVFVEALKDVVFRVAPLTRLDAADMVDGIRGRPILDGIRGEAPADIAAIVDVLLRISQMTIDFPQIAELDINPLLASDAGVVAVDGRVMLGHDQPTPGGR
jgi:acetyl coenzyme A synthetase (ADP forming)-like protein